LTRGADLRHVRIIWLCEDYRAGATIDFDLDEADRGRRGSPARCWRYGARPDRWRGPTSSGPGARGRTTSAAPRCRAGTTSRRRRRRTPTRRCATSSPLRRRHDHADRSDACAGAL